MRALKIEIAILCAVFIVSAVTGFSWFVWDSRTGLQVGWFVGWERLWSVAGAIVSALAYWGVHRRIRITYPLGVTFIIASGVFFVFEAFRLLLPQPYGWVGALAVAVFTPFVALDMSSRWRRYRPYFYPDEDEET